MTPDTDNRSAQAPRERFEERLLSRILSDYDELTRPPVRHRRASARLRVASRRARIGIAVPVLAGAVIAALEIVSSPGSGRSVGAGATIPGRDTAYVVGRVRAHLAELAVAGEGRVLERSGTLGDGSDGGPVVENTDWAYIDPRTKVAYQRSVDRSADGTVLSIDRLVTTPVGNLLHTEVTFLDPVRHAYDVVTDAPPSGTVSAARSVTALGMRSTARQIDQALRSSRVTERGTATVDGRTTIRLSVPLPAGMVNVGLPARTRITLYVDARSYEPVQEVETIPREPGSTPATSVSRWLPTTRRTIALAKVRIPDDYRRVTGPVTDFWTSAKPLFFIGY